jgi:peptide/nickel transport system substrate-binding protein
MMIIRIFGALLCAILLSGGFGQSHAQPTNLRVGLIELPPSLGNPYSSMGLPSGHFWSSIYDGLTHVSAQGEVQPALAVAWEQVEPTLWHFTLRQDIHFHNGTLFDTQDVVATIEYLTSDDAARFLVANEVKNIAGARALSNHLVEITTIEPDVILPRRLSIVMIIEDQDWLRLGPEQYALAPIGTGPFKFIEWRNSNSSVVLQAFESPLRPVTGIGTLTLMEVRNAVARVQALLSGQLDLIDAVTPDSVPEIEAAGFDILVTPRSQILSVALPNTVRDNSPLNSADVRRALNFGIDRSAIAQFIYGGLVDVASQGAVEGTIGFNPTLEPFPYDPDEAKRLLSKAGYPSGFNFTIGYLQADGQSSEVAYQKIAQDLTAIGVVTEMRSMSASEFLRRFMSGDWGPYDAFTLLWNSEPIRDTGRTLEYFSCLRPQPFFCDQDVADAILESRSERDPEARRRSLEEIMSRMHELAPAIWLNNMAQISASSPNIKNVRLGMNGLAFEDIVIGP